MLYKDSIARTTFITDKKYFFRAEAKWTKQSIGSKLITVRAEIFEGSPANLGNETIHVIGCAAETSDLLDAIQRVEAACRQYIAGLEQ
jgi:hypothetical protein